MSTVRRAALAVGRAASRRYGGVHSRSITTQVHKRAELGVLPEYVRRFALELSANRHALDDVESALALLGNADAGHVVEKLERQTFYRFLADIRRNPSNRSAVEMAVNLIKISELTWRDQRRLPPNDVVSEVMRKFGLGSRINLSPGRPEERGQFFGYVDGRPSLLSEKDLAGITTLIFDGIDQDGIGITSRVAVPLTQHVNSDKMAAYHYYTSAAERGAVLAGILQDRNEHRAEHMRTAIKLLKARTGKDGKPSLDMTSVRYSFGVFHGWGVEHAMYELLTDSDGEYQYTAEEASAVLGEMRTVNVGVQPLWAAGEDWAVGARQSINIWSGGDLFGPHSFWTRNLLRKTVAIDPAERPACVAYVNPVNHNQVFLSLAPEAVPSVLYSPEGKPIANIGGHSFPHYLAPFALIDGVVVEDKSMRRAGEVIQGFMQGKKLPGTLAEQLREAGIAVEFLNKPELRAEAEEMGCAARRACDEEIMRYYAELLARETLALKGRHPMIDAITKGLN